MPDSMSDKSFSILTQTEELPKGTVSCVVPGALDISLDIYCEKMQYRRSTVIREALYEYLERRGVHAR